jgi:hypothetical protein
MKVSPIAASGAATVANSDVGHSAGAERRERAVAVIEGRAPEAQTASAPVDPQVQQVQNSIKKIKMRTQQSTNRHEAPVENVEVTPESTVLASTEQAPAVAEATQPLSPQFAALAKAKRSLQAKEREIAAREAALSAPADTTSVVRSKEQIQADLLSDLREGRVSYDDLTQAIMSQDGGNSGIAELRAEIKALKEGFDQNLSQRDQVAEQQVLTQIRSEVDQMVANGDEYEAVRQAGYQPKVVELIHKVFKKEGVIMDSAEAAALIENELIEQAMPYVQLKKVQSRLTPAEAAQQQQPAKQSGPNTKIMRTLTNRDGTSSISMSKRDRAIAAMEGRLKR